METVVRPVTVTALVEVKTAWCSATRCPSAEEIGRDSMMVKKMMTRKKALIAVREGDARTEESMKSRKRSRVFWLNSSGVRLR